MDFFASTHTLELGGIDNHIDSLTTVVNPRFSQRYYLLMTLTIQSFMYKTPNYLNITLFVLQQSTVIYCVEIALDLLLPPFIEDFVYCR